MRRTYISPEFIYNRVYGTLNMREDCAFFGSKMMEIEDSLSILKDNLVYYQAGNGEQRDLDNELELPEIVYDATIDKNVNHRLAFGVQTDDEKRDLTKWVLTINLKTIMRNYLFATLKRYRTFEGVKNEHVLENSVDTAIFDYIDKNIYSRYTVDKLEIFLLPVDLCGDNTLQYKNIFDPFIEGDANKFTTFTPVYTEDNSLVQISFKQTKNAEDFSFKYYYNIYFKKL